MAESRILKTIALIETMWSGHHPTYFKLYCKALAEMGHNVWALCPRPDELNHWLQLRRREGSGRVSVFSFHEPSSLIYRVLNRLVPSAFANHSKALFRWKAAATQLREISLLTKDKADLAFFMYVDHYYVVPGLPRELIHRLFPYPWSGLYFHPRHLRNGKISNFNPDKLFMLDECKCVAVLDEGIANKLAPRIKNKPVIVFPDITDDETFNGNHPLVLNIREKAKGRKLIGLIGNLTKSKGLLELIAVAKSTKEYNWFYVFAGKFEESAFTAHELRILRSAAISDHENCFFHFHTLHEGSEYNSLIAILDVVYAARRDFPHSSNTLTKAALFGNPVLVAGSGCLAERVRRYNLGEVVDTLEVESIIHSLESLLRYNKKGDIDRGYDKYATLHSESCLRKSFHDLISHY